MGGATVGHITIGEIDRKALADGPVFYGTRDLTEATPFQLDRALEAAAKRGDEFMVGALAMTSLRNAWDHRQEMNRIVEEGSRGIFRRKSTVDRATVEARRQHEIVLAYEAVAKAYLVETTEE